MKPAIDIHASWLRQDLASTSDTWNWFYLERWSHSSAFARTDMPFEYDIGSDVPDAYNAIVQTAMWIVAEALRRDGISRDRLSADNMRWARRLGLALLGDGPALGLDLPRRRSAPSSDDGHPDALRFARLMLALFSPADQLLLKLALPFLPEGEPTPGLAPIAPTKKTDMLVRLAKRHAAASVGVDLRDTTSESSAARAAGHFVQGAEAVNEMPVEVELHDFEPTYPMEALRAK